MTEKNRILIDDIWLNILTGREELDVVGQNIDKEQYNVLEEAEILRKAILSINQKEKAEVTDMQNSVNELIARLKKKNLL